jgi:tetratricopeptide (TPR) repeat protein
MGSCGQHRDDGLGILHRRGDRAAAADAFNRAVACDAKDAEAVYNRGRLHTEMGQPTAAIADFTAAIAADPAFRDAYYNRAVLLIRGGRTADARADIEAFVRLGGHPPVAVLALVGLAAKP